MQKIVGTVLVLIALMFFWLAPANAKTLALKIGDTTVKVKVTERGSGLTYIALHDNENTAVTAAKSIIASHGGRLIELSHGGGRNITFTLKGKSYSFDPNRMFTNLGIRATLTRQGAYSEEAHLAINEFALAVAEIIIKPQPARGVLIAIHNNSNGNYSAMSYQKGNQYQRDASMVYINPKMDPDDFFLVTKSSVANAIKTKGFNVVLQSNRPTDDGSLSVICGRIGVSYINVEAQEGHGSIQKQMLQLLSP